MECTQTSLALVKDKYGSDAEFGTEEEDSEDLESEDEDGEELTPAMDAAILRTLARIKRRDPTIYENTKSVFDGMAPSPRLYVLYQPYNRGARYTGRHTTRAKTRQGRESKLFVSRIVNMS